MPKPVSSIRPPSLGTVRKYGLTIAGWLAILKRQGNVCRICGKVPKSGRWVTDHEHVRQWRWMAPEQRRWYVRGIICPFCNSHCVGRFMTLAKARNIVEYLEAHERAKEVSGADTQREAHVRAAAAKGRIAAKRRRVRRQLKRVAVATPRRKVVAM